MVKIGMNSSANCTAHAWKIFTIRNRKGDLGSKMPNTLTLIVTLIVTFTGKIYRILIY